MERKKNNSTTAILVFDRKHVADKSTKKGLVQIEVYHDRKRKWISTGVKVYKDQWSDKGWVKNTTQSIELNKQLEQQLNIVNTYINECLEGNMIFSFEDIPTISIAALYSDNSLLNLFEKIIDIKKNDPSIREQTYKTYKTAYNKLVAYGKLRSLDDATPAAIKAFDEWLWNKNNNKGGTIKQYHNKISTTLNYAVEYCMIKENPYHKVKLRRFKKPDRVYLTKEELQAIINFKCKNECQERTRDEFVFQCYTGLSYIDLKNFDKNKVVERDGRKFYIQHRVKTGETFYLMLIKQAVTILEKYNYHFTMVNYGNYNIYINDIGKKLGLPKRISSHIGRHTFAVLCLNMGIPIETLAKMMGHTDIKTTQIYAKIVNKSIDNAFLLIEENL